MNGAIGLGVVDPGLFTTVQDLGRTGYRAFGVPLGGAADTVSHRLANALVGNEPDVATLELTLVGGTYEAIGGPLALGLAGAPLEGRVERVDDEPRGVAVPQSLTLEPGDRLVLGAMTRGARAYLAVAGGWRTPLRLGSRSREEPVQPGDFLPARDGRIAVRHPRIDDRPTAAPRQIRVVDGPDAAMAPGIEWELTAYKVAATSDRVGVRLEGRRPIRVAADDERLSAPVAPGAVQVAGGSPIVLGVACGTMGGYPHVAQVVSADLHLIGQARPGAFLSFRRIAPEEAWALDRKERRRRDGLAMVIRASAGVEG